MLLLCAISHFSRMAFVDVPGIPPPDHPQGVPTEPQGLPIELVAKVLQHVPLQNRLQRCALVHSSWCKAAASATSSINITCSTQAQLDSAVAWLAKHGQAVTQLIMAAADHPDAEPIQLRELPCANLSDLQLSAPTETQPLPAPRPFTLHNTLSSTVPSLFSTCTALQRLEIRNCHALVPASLSVENGWSPMDCRPFHALYSVPHLTSTSLALYGVGDTGGCHFGNQLDLTPVLSLTALKSLTLSDGGQLGQPLQVGSIFEPGYVQPSRRWGPPGMYSFTDLKPPLEAAAGASGQAWPLAALTHLCFDFWSGNFPQYITLPNQDLTKLTALRHLTVQDCHGFSADLLENLTQLETLVLDSVDLDQDSEYGPIHKSTPTATLLQAVLNMQQLRRLELRGPFSNDNLACFAPAADYAALTASSKLEVLKLPNVALPKGVWGHVFKKGRQLPNLVQLVVGSMRHSIQMKDAEFAALAPGRVHGEDIERIASCCPHLQRLEIVERHVQVQQLAPLLQLTALTELVVSDNLPKSHGKLQLAIQVGAAHTLELLQP